MKCKHYNIVMVRPDIIEFKNTIPNNITLVAATKYLTSDEMRDFLNDVSDDESIIKPKELDPSEAVAFGYNMLQGRTVLILYRIYYSMIPASFTLLNQIMIICLTILLFAADRLVHSNIHPCARLISRRFHHRYLLPMNPNCHMEV